MTTDHTDAQRFELKYLIDERIAHSIRQYIRAYLKPDDFAAGLPGYSYPVHTLYLDSPDLATYRAVRDGEKDRFKLRVRFYDDSADGPAYFEVKRRLKVCIAKSRAKVRRDAVHALLGGQTPQMRHLYSPNPKHLAALQEFCRLMRTLRASPRSHVAYMREAWTSPLDGTFRITFDRQVQCEAEFEFRLRTGVNDAVTAFENQVILELKFVGKLPKWCRAMVKNFGLRRSGAPKYVAGIRLLGEERMSSGGATAPARAEAGHACVFPIGISAVAAGA
jgi:hypothetical protein